MTDLPPAPLPGSTFPPRRNPAITALVVIGPLAVVVAVVMTALVGTGTGDADAGTRARPALAIDGAQARVEPAPPAAEPAPAQDQAPVEDPVVPDGASESRIDFTGVTCDMIGDEAVYISQGTADLPIRLIDVRETYPIEDLRPQYPLPVPGVESTVMSCGGIGDWDDTSSSHVYLELTVSSEGAQYVYYLRE